MTTPSEGEQLLIDFRDFFSSGFHFIQKLYDILIIRQFFANQSWIGRQRRQQVVEIMCNLSRYPAGGF